MIEVNNNLMVNLTLIHEQMVYHSDVTIREFLIGNTGVAAAIVFANCLADRELIDLHILKALMSVQGDGTSITKSFVTNQVLSVSQITEVLSVEEMMPKVLSGSTALIIDGFTEAIIIGTIKNKTRNIEEPISEALVRGPRVGFNESLTDNAAILRRHGENASLALVSMHIGSRAKKELVIAYMKDIADPNLVEEVRKRMGKIDLDNVPESGYIEQLIEDNYLSPFPQVQSTERPDRVISALMEGRVAILLDGTPFALIAPVTFSMLLQSPEDYYERWMAGTLLRLLRFFAALVALLTPAMYISFISFHPGLIPTKLALSIIGSRVGVPFSSLVEALIMEVAIEILREAGLRLPKPIGPAMGIVGGLIIGEAAVQAGIVSPILVIVVAVTAISSFAIPQYNAGISLRMLRFVAMFCAAAFGLYGVVLFILMLCAHIVKLKSFGVPYASPAVPYRLNDWKDFFVRMPLFMMKSRPEMLHTKNEKRKKL
ncbi:MAG: spore germination protein [Bacillota bacterium]